MLLEDCTTDSYSGHAVITCFHKLEILVSFTVIHAPRHTPKDILPINKDLFSNFILLKIKVLSY